MKQPQGFQPQDRRNGRWTGDSFWEVERPLRQCKTNTAYPYRRRRNRIRNGLRPVGTGGPDCQLGKIRGRQERPVHKGHAAKVDAEDHNNLDLGNAVKETEKQFATDVQLLMRETTNDPSLFKNSFV